MNRNLILKIVGTLVLLAVFFFACATSALYTNLYLIPAFLLVFIVAALVNDIFIELTT